MLGHQHLVHQDQNLQQHPLHQQHSHSQYPPLPPAPSKDHGPEPKILSANGIGHSAPPPPSHSTSSVGPPSSSMMTVKSLSLASLPPAYPQSGPSTPLISSTPISSAPGAGYMDILPPNSSEKFTPNVKKAKYSTSLDPRGYIPVYEYELYGHPIMWDQDNLYVHFTGIWKALGKTKADIVKIIDANPILETIIRKVRGGFLKIQGTWMPHQEAYDLAKKACYKLRYELVPVFGPSFVNDCVPPGAPGYGSIHLTLARRRASECAVGQRTASLNAQHLRLQQAHSNDFPCLKRRYSTNDMSRIAKFSNNNNSSNGQSSFLLQNSQLRRQHNRQRMMHHRSRNDDDLDDDDDDVENEEEEDDDDGSMDDFGVSNAHYHHQDHTMGDGNEERGQEDEDRRSSSFEDEDIDIEGDSYSSEQDDPMYGLARLDLSRRNSSPMPLNHVYSASANGSTSSLSSITSRSKRGRPPNRAPLPIPNRVAANYVAYNNYVSSNSQAGQSSGRNGARSQSLKQQRQRQQQQQQGQPSRSFVQQPPQAPSLIQPASHLASTTLTRQELVEFVRAGQALQRMSQDDGIRPWKNESSRIILPKKIVLGEQVFQCVGGEYKCIVESNTSTSIKPAGHDDDWTR